MYFAKMPIVLCIWGRRDVNVISTRRLRMSHTTVSTLIIFSCYPLASSVSLVTKFVKSSLPGAWHLLYEVLGGNIPSTVQ